ELDSRSRASVMTRKLVFFRSKSTFLGPVVWFVAEARTMRLSLTFFALCLVLPAAALATGDKASRYPFDPVCPWGRLSNGKGMIHRCITEDEARTLAESAEIPTNREKGPEEDTSRAAPKSPTS